MALHFAFYLSSNIVAMYSVGTCIVLDLSCMTRTLHQSYDALAVATSKASLECYSMQ